MTVAKILVTAVFAALLSLPRFAFAQGVDGGAPEPNADKKAEARTHFDLGLSHLDREEWQAALAEFQLARQLFPTKGTTKNTAIAMRKVGRYAESLDLFEVLIRDYKADLSPAERALADREITELRASVGTIEIQGAPVGASVTIDAVDYGKTPLGAPLRLSAGGHSIRVVKDGFLPFEARVDLAGKQAASVSAQLAPLTQAGRLKVNERSGKALDIVVDGSVVGKTPSWEGALAPGTHTVLLRGEAELGTQPVSVVVKVDQAAVLDLDAEELPAVLAITPTPAGAIVTLDGVDVAHGRWVGRLRAGPHDIRVRLEGFIPRSRVVTLANDANETVEFLLESAAPKGRSGLQFEIDLAATLGLLHGGDVSASCAEPCTASVPLGFGGLFHGSYRFPSGWGLGVHAGYMTLARSLKGRRAQVTPFGKTPSDSLVDDDLALGGLLVGADAQFDTAGDWPLTLRLGAGIFLGKMKDTRTGNFTYLMTTPFNVDTSQSQSATSLYVAPEVRLGRRIGENFEINVGVEFLVMGALSTPKWDAGDNSNNGKTPAVRDFLAFPSQTLSAGVMILAMPGIGAKLQF